MTKRTDIHRPSAIVPADYTYVAQLVFKAEYDAIQLVQEERSIFNAHQAQTGAKFSDHNHGGQCHCCGSVNAIYTCAFYHAKTNSYIALGSTCAEKLEMGSANAFKAIQHATKSFREAKAGRTKCIKMLADAGVEFLFEVAREWDQTSLTKQGWIDSKGYATWSLNVLRDIISRAVKYGKISPKQMALISGMPAKVKADLDRQAKWEANKVAEKADQLANGTECPTGRGVVTGTVLSTKLQESRFGCTWKMLVKDDEGFKVWGSIPSDLDVAKGDKVTFTARLEQSKDDAYFGFFKRPTKASVLVKAPEVAS